MIKALVVGVALIIGGFGLFFAAMFGLGCIIQRLGFFADLPAIAVGTGCFYLAMVSLFFLGVAVVLGDSFINEVWRNK